MRERFSRICTKLSIPGWLGWGLFGWRRLSDAFDIADTAALLNSLGWGGRVLNFLAQWGWLFGTIWLVVLLLWDRDPPRFGISSIPCFLPYRWEWDDAGGHQILFRIGIHNLSKTKPILGAEVRLTEAYPTIRYVPCHLLLMNEKQAVKKLTLLPGSPPKFADLIQQTHGVDGRSLRLWDTVEWSQKVIKPEPLYTLKITASADNAKTEERKFQLIQEEFVWVLKPLLSNPSAVDKQ